MEDFFEDYETLGLPGGPNELKKFTNGFIISERGQWDYPGQPTAVPTPSGRITMEGVEDDLLGIDNLGNTQYMTPGNEYQFEGDMVYEIPQAKKGGSKKPSKKYSRSLMAKNRLFSKNPLLKKIKSAKNKIYDPYSPYFQPGGEIDLPQNVGIAYLPEDGRSYYDPLSDTINLNPNANDAELNHELVHAWQNRTGRLRSNPNLPQQRPPIVASDEQAASYYTRKGDEVDQYISNLKNIYPEMTGNIWTEDLDRFIPDQIKYDRAVEPLMYEDANTMEGEAEYLSQTRGRPGGIGFRQEGGFMDVELDDSEIEEYRRGGYIVEDISVPSLTKASYGHSVGNLIRKDDGGSVSGTQGLTADFSQRLTQMILDARAQGVDLGVGSGYRSYEKQEKLWQQALKKYGSPEKARKWVAPPGGSFHNKGLAVDLNANGQFLGKDANSKATEWAHANAKKYGLHFRMGHEPWHIEPIEKTKSNSDKENEHDHEHDDEVGTFGDQPKPTTQEEYDKMVEDKNLEFELKQKELAERERKLHDDDYSNWKPAKTEVVDPRQQILDQYSKIMEPSSQNVFEQYNANIQGQMKDGGFIMELTDKEIERYRKGGFIIEELD
jgi:hypothetical protein